MGRKEQPQLKEPMPKPKVKGMKRTLKLRTEPPRTMLPMTKMRKRAAKLKAATKMTKRAAKVMKRAAKVTKRAAKVTKREAKETRAATTTLTKSKQLMVMRKGVPRRSPGRKRTKTMTRRRKRARTNRQKLIQLVHLIINTMPHIFELPILYSI